MVTPINKLHMGLGYVFSWQRRCTMGILEVNTTRDEYAQARIHIQRHMNNV